MSIAALRGSGGTGSGMAIGDPVSGGTSQSVLYIDGSGNLAQDNPTFTYDSTSNVLVVQEGVAIAGVLAAENAIGDQSTRIYRKGTTSATIGGMWVLDLEVTFTDVLVAGFAPSLTIWYFGPNHTQTATTSTFATDVNVPDEAYGAGWNGSLEVPTKNAIYDKIESLSPGGGGNAVTSTLAFGASFTDKAQTVVTGQAWVTANSEIIAQVLTPSGTDPDEIRLLDFKPVISDLVAGDGFTVTLYSEAEAKGDYSVMCIGV